MVKLTYFTPTYNRANLLPRLYDCLVNQTDKNFVWLIVDDGSTDNTRELVEKWQTENRVQIKYVYQENGGKHTAMNLAHEICETEYLCCCDSDDQLTVDATAVIERYVERFDNDESIVGFVGRGTNAEYGKKLDNWPGAVTKVWFYDLYDKYHYTGETLLIFRTNIVKKYQFPVFPGERFVTESVLYKQFFYDYQFIAFPEKVHPREYQSGGYTQQGRRLFYRNPRGTLFARKQDAACAIQHAGFLERVKRATIYYLFKSVFAIQEDVAPQYQISFPYNFIGKLAQLVFLPKYQREYRQFQREQKGK